MSLPRPRVRSSHPPTKRRDAAKCCSGTSLHRRWSLLTFRQSPNTGRDRWGFHSMSKRTLTVSLLTAGLTAGILATAVGPAAAQQGNPVGGHGSVYFLSGAVNDSGKAQKVYAFGDPGDEVYYGDWYGVGEDMPMVRRGNVFYVPKANDIYQTSHIFVYGDRGDTVLVGDWDGDGKDTLSIRRGNQYLVKNDNTKSGKADSEFFYGDSDDVVLVGNWDGKVAAPKGGIDRNNDKDFDDKGAPAYAADLMNRVPAATPGTAFVDNTVPADGDYTDTTIQSLRYQPIPDGAVPASGPEVFVVNADDTTGGDNTLRADGDTTDTPLQPLPYQPTADTYIGDPGFDADKDGIYEDGDRVPGTGVDNNGDGDFTDNATAATSGDVAPVPAKGDTLMIQRGNEFFVKNSITTGKADYTFFFGDAGDTILVGDWATAAKAKTKTENAKPAVGANGADQLAVRRDNVYHLSTELEAARTSKTNP